MSHHSLSDIVYPQFYVWLYLSWQIVDEKNPKNTWKTKIKKTFLSFLYYYVYNHWASFCIIFVPYMHTVEHMLCRIDEKTMVCIFCNSCNVHKYVVITSILCVSVFSSFLKLVSSLNIDLVSFFIFSWRHGFVSS